MKLKKVQYFLKIVEKGSLSKAANSVGLIQPTLTRFLAGLEKEAGTKLFSRGKDNSLTLTTAGLIYLEAARKINVIWNNMLADLRNEQDNSTE